MEPYIEGEGEKDFVKGKTIKAAVMVEPVIRISPRSIFPTVSSMLRMVAPRISVFDGVTVGLLTIFLM